MVVAAAAVPYPATPVTMAAPTTVSTSLRAKAGAIRARISRPTAPAVPGSRPIPTQKATVADHTNRIHTAVEAIANIAVCPTAPTSEPALAEPVTAPIAAHGIGSSIASAASAAIELKSCHQARLTELSSTVTDVIS